LKKLIPLLNFEEFWGELGMLEISLCWDICPLFFYFYFPLLSFFRAPKPLLEILMEVVIGIFGALLDNKRASNG
jgi:hypothetical protein